MTPASSSKFHASILIVVIGSMSTALYLSPTGQQVRSEIKKAIPFIKDDAPARPKAKAAPQPSPGPAALAVAATPTPSPTPSPTAPTPSTPGPVPGAPPSSGDGIEGCWDFTFQQDAQAYYVRDISDPLGLDGPKGPANGDGLACTHLPVDPDRARSIPVGAYQPAIASRHELVAPEKKFFGVAEDGIPGDTKLMDKLARQVGKAPSMVEWFTNFDETFNGGKVDKSWNRGALPVITWMPAHKGNKNASDTSLQRIADGEWDAYVATWAEDVVKTGKPIVIRFGHEQNGNWYPWSAGGNRAFERGDRGEPFFNTPELYKQSWRRVWNIFEAAGANDLVIWNWAPVRVDDVKPNLTDKTRESYGLSAVGDSYPGDAYVDWVGLSAYSYKGTEWSYSKTFAKSFAALEAVAPGKPILIAETGASENSGPQSNAYRKPLWIEDTLAGLATHPSVVGFVWFNNTVVDVHTIDGIKVTTDNKWDSSEASLAAFIAGVANPIWMTGTGPDDMTTVTSTPELATTP